MKKTILFIICAMSFLAVSAQSEEARPFKISLGPTIAGTGDALTDTATFSVGIEVQATHYFTKNIAVFGQTGIDIFQGKKHFDGTEVNIFQIPAIVGIRCKVAGVMAGIGAGAGIWTGDLEAIGFLYSPQIGYEFRKMQILADYTSTTTSYGKLSYLGCKVYFTLQ